MAQFVHGTELNLALENLISHADDFLWFISPYIKLHDRIKKELINKKDCHDLQIVVVFGKNEGDVSKSFGIDDFNFLKEFPNVLICYEKNLHAKFYASEESSILSSMNLHEFSQNNNVEAGIVLYPKDAVTKLANTVVSTNNTCETAMDYFGNIIEKSEHIFRKTPEYKSGLLGFTKTYVKSNIETDKTTEFFKGVSKNYSPSKSYSQSNYQASSFKKQFNKYQQNGYCIRTGVQIPFNPEQPMCYEAYLTWNQFGNPDYPEKFCHATGEPSNGKTNMRNPILF